MNIDSVAREALWGLLTTTSWSRDAGEQAEAAQRLGPVQVELLLRLPPATLQSLSVQLDRLLVSSVKFGRPPQTFTEIMMSTREAQADGDGSSRGYTDALWLAITDSEFRRACFGNAAEALGRRGITLSEEELGKFRWFDADKLALFGERMTLEMDKCLQQDKGSGLRDCAEGAQWHPGAGSAWSATDHALGLTALYEDHCAAVALIEREGARLAASEHSMPGEFDTGVPAPDYPAFLNILHALRQAGGDPNPVLQATGYSFGRLLLLLQHIRRKDIELPRVTASPLPDLPSAVKWFHQVSCAGRPRLNETFHQSPCSPESVIDRVAHIARHVWLRDRKLVVLGDDDALCIALAKHTEAEVHVVDIDPDVLGYLRQCADRAGVEVVMHEHDLRQPLPPALTGAFWLASADPPQNARGTTFFLDRALDALQPMPGLRIYCSTTPMWLGRTQVQSIANHANARGLVLHDILKCAMKFYINHAFDDTRALPDVGPLGATLMQTLNMACDVHIYERGAIT